MRLDFAMRVESRGQASPRHHPTRTCKHPLCATVGVTCMCFYGAGRRPVCCGLREFFLCPAEPGPDTLESDV